MTKYGMSFEKHDRPIPETPELGCTFYSSQPCKANHQCCFFCGIFYRCQEGRCMQAWYAMKQQPKPMPFRCPKAKSVIDITWDMVFEHGTDTY